MSEREEERLMDGAIRTGRVSALAAARGGSGRAMPTGVGRGFGAKVGSLSH